MKVFSERLRELREDKKITTRALGDALGVRSSTISRWENSQILPTIDHLKNIAEYFGVTADYLIGLED